MKVNVEKTSRMEMGSRAILYMAITLVVLIVVLWGAIYLITIREEEKTLDSVIQRSETIATFFEQHAAATFRYADDYIKTVRKIYLQDGSFASMQKYMAEIPPNSNILSHITIMNADGVPQLISTGVSEKKIKPGTHARDRDYFIFQKSNNEDSVFISVARKGRNTGLVTVRLVRRISNSAGEFRGLIFAAVKVSQLLNFFETTRLGPQSSATLVGLDKQIRIRQSQNGLEGAGKKIPKSKLWSNLANNDTGIYYQTSIIDEIPRIWTYHKVKDYPLVAVVGASIPDMLESLADVKQFRYTVAVLISIIGGILFLLARRAIVNTKLGIEIEERKIAEIRLHEAKEIAEKANHAKSEFLSSMSHELRTPMNSILGFGQMLEQNPNEPLSKVQQKCVGQILRGGEYLLYLIDQVLDLAKIEAGKMIFSPEHVRLEDLCQECLTLIDEQARQRGLTIESDLDTASNIRADYNRFRQVLLNLLSNAIKYNREGGKLTIACRDTSDNMIRVSVSDTGEGISKDHQSRLFEPFNRLGYESGEIEGTGIGLTIAKKLIEGMGGRIGFESEVGKGSTFWVEMPTMDDATQKISAPEIDLIGNDYQAPAVKKSTVLYIEDNKANLQLMEMIIDNIGGLTLISAYDAELGLEIAELRQPDMILLDIGLPGMDGLSAKKALDMNNRTKDIPVIAISAAAMQSDIDKGMAAGFEAYLTKPLMVQEVIEIIQKILNIED